METEKKVQKQNLVAMAEFDCSNCGNKMMAKVPQMRILNWQEMSGVLFSHERPTACPNCATQYLPLLAGISERMELKMVWRVVQQKEPKAMTIDEKVTTKKI